MVLDYRHVIEHLLRKPGAFEGYRYRAELFPRPVFREAYDRLVAEQGKRRGDLEYLRLLKLASEAGENEVEMMLVGYVSPPYPAWSVEQIRRVLVRSESPPVCLAELQPECRSYDALLTESQEVSDVH